MVKESAKPLAEQLLTLGQLAERLGVATHQLKYALEQYRIEPVRRVGILRCWSDDDLPRIRSALARVAANRRREQP